jgi:hypothetical protein
MMRLLAQIFVFGMACAMAYQSYDSLRSAYMGTQPNASAPDKNPKSLKTRAAGVVWGIMSMAIALTAFFFLFFGRH